MKEINVYCIATHKDLFRPGVLSKVIGFKMAQPSAILKPRLCFKIKFLDGKIDWLPLSDLGVTYKIAPYIELLEEQKL